MAGALTGGVAHAAAESAPASVSVQVGASTQVICEPTDWPWLLPKPC